jgi:hypothetical protein
VKKAEADFSHAALRPFRANIFFGIITQGFAMGYGYAVLSGLNARTLPN